jgi:two-component system cell cycle response regulator
MTARVLVVDDLPANLKLLEARLTAEYFDVVTAADGATALARAVEVSPDIILLDVMMPGMDGFECCRLLRADPRTRHIPVVMLTALSGTEDRLRGLDAGADDFLSKPVNDLALNARIRSLVRLKTLADEWRLRQTTSMELAEEIGVESERAEHFAGARLFLIGDNPLLTERLVRGLSPDRHTVVCSEDIDAALVAMDRGGFDLAIVDLQMRAADGLRCCARIRGQPSTRNLPVLALVDQGDHERLARALDLGVNDYLELPLERNELLARVRTQVRRHRYQQRLRSSLQQSVAASITDSLTGLHNRLYLARHLDALVVSAARGDKPLSLLVIDIDRFKSINDGFGHAAGDSIIRFVASRLQQNVRNFDSVGRWGGDEFLIAMPEAGPNVAMIVAERLRRTIAALPVAVSGHDVDIPVTVSIGMSAFQGSGDSAEAMLSRADEGLYAAKRAGRDRVGGSAPGAPCSAHAS